MKHRIGTALAIALAVLGATAPGAAAGEYPDKVVASGAKPVSWVDDGCYIHVHRETRRRPQDELHLQCTVGSGSLGEGAVVKYRYPERGKPTSFGARIEEDGHGRLGDIPFMRAWQDPEHPRIGYIYAPGPGPLAAYPNGTYVHVMYVVWNGPLDDTIREVNLKPYG